MGQLSSENKTSTVRPVTDQRRNPHRRNRSGRFHNCMVLPARNRLRTAGVAALFIGESSVGGLACGPCAGPGSSGRHSDERRPMHRISVRSDGGKSPDAYSDPTGQIITHHLYVVNRQQFMRPAPLYRRKLLMESGRQNDRLHINSLTHTYDGIECVYNRQAGAIPHSPRNPSQPYHDKFYQ